MLSERFASAGTPLIGQWRCFHYRPSRQYNKAGQAEVTSRHPPTPPYSLPHLITLPPPPPTTTTTPWPHDCLQQPVLKFMAVKYDLYSSSWLSNTTCTQAHDCHTQLPLKHMTVYYNLLSCSCLSNTLFTQLSDCLTLPPPRVVVRTIQASFLKAKKNLIKFTVRN